MFTMLVPSMRVLVASSSSSTCTRSPPGELPTQSAPKPRDAPVMNQVFMKATLLPAGGRSQYPDRATLRP